MLDSETKRRIDTARDILVGKVPDPKSQVEQITIALIYKFMDDMDAQAEELGGKRKFFAGEFAQYGWAKLMSPQVGGHELVGLYRDALERVPQNDKLPKLFRAILADADLPYRDPETLKLFLKTINEFEYDHSERLGDAFEYLLSVLGSQGDAGQFRTPRHIIDFIVSIVDPKKNETVLDPACGTAGFMISAYKHINAANAPQPSPQPSPSGRGSTDVRHYRGGFDFSGLKKRARELRANQTDAEKLLWELLRDRQLCNAKFRRQHQLGDYVVDFYCHDANLIVECDGAVHGEPERAKIDSVRDKYLQSQGATVLRLTNEQVLNETDSAVERIAARLEPSPSGRGQGEGVGQSGSSLTPDEKKRLADNLRGYDISPDMVRLSLVNMYLHGFTDPHVYEYDTLTSQDRWNEMADVILANPPFMSPKGGIKPHNKFSVQSKRSEVLFVDYMAEHLTPAGRAGIIVPEGIIFQSQAAYKALRKMLVEQYLVAVVSLPAGVFNPYSGVKTSILILDKSLAKQSDTVGLFKVENDGFGLGAQRRPIDKNDLPAVREEIQTYLQHLRGAAHEVSGFSTRENGTPLTSCAAPPYTTGLIVAKEKIAANGDYNLSGERYRDGAARASKFPFVALGEVCELARGVVYNKGDEVESGGVPVLRANNIDLATSSLDLGDVKRIAPKEDFSDDKKLRKDDIFICLASGSKDHIGKVALIPTDTDFYFGGFMGAVRVKPDRALPAYLFHQLRNSHFNDFLREQIAGANINNLSGGLLYRFEIPLPPLEVQEEIVAEIEAYQRVSDGARAVLDHYRPHIPIQPDWPMVELGKLCDFKNGLNFRAGEAGEAVKIIGVGDFQAHLYAPIATLGQVHLDEAISDDYLVKPNDIVFVRSNGNPDLVGRSMIVPCTDERVTFTGFSIRARVLDESASPIFLAHFFKSREFAERIKEVGQGANIKNLSQGILNDLRIPLPPLETQRSIVSEIEAERRLVEANRELIARMETKIAATLARIWGEAPSEVDVEAAIAAIT